MQVDRSPVQQLGVDVLLVVDDSASMEGLQGVVGDFAQQLTEALVASRVDFRVGVVTTDPARKGALVERRGEDVALRLRTVQVDTFVPAP
ncbi:MAG: hypothetical protein KTR31_18315 [Myxococcales bacterium]|nr:hypothetical protein [Myxococcales bacterium]